MHEEHPEGQKTGGTSVKSFVRRHRNEILAEWRRAAREVPVAKHLNASRLIDHIPDLVDEIAELAELPAEAAADFRLETARRHAVDRLAEGFDISAVVRELSLLRDAILVVWDRSNSGGAVAELRALNVVIDRAISVSAARFAEAHERTLAGIDRISTASFESRDVDDLLRRLLAVFLETTPAVDTAAIFLVEGEQLVLRAAVGLEGEIEEGASMPLGEGFAGSVATERQPKELRSAYLDPLVRSEVLRRRKVRALHGIPLIHDDTVIGVAHMGSVGAHEFSSDDRQFFASMAQRATLGIVHHMLRQEVASSEEKFKRIASERERALAKLESLLAASPVGIAFVDRQLRYLRINAALAALNGKPIADHIGRSVSEVLPEAAPKLEPMLQRVLATGEPLLNMEFSHDSRDLLANYFPVRAQSGEITGVGGIILDITEAKRAQKALQLEQKRLESILEHSPAAIWLKDPQGRVVLANRRLAEALGHEHEHEHVIGRRSTELMPREIASGHEAHDTLVLRDQRSIEVEEVVPSPTGERTFLSIKFPIPGDPPLVGGIATEITERKRIEQELRDAVRTREELLAIVSHDLRSPLGTVQLSASMLLGEATLDHRLRRHVEMIHRACARMEHLIDDLLDTASIRAGKLQLDIKRESADSIVAEAVDLQRSTAAEKGLALVSQRDLGDAVVLCDRDRILQVFVNLIANAIKFCRAGDTITVGAERTEKEVVFSVGDTGPGIAPDVQRFVFQPYWSATEHVKIGSGLGLYISHGIVERHGGRIWVESVVGKGSKFLFALPLG